MTESQTQSMPQVADIAAEALEVFCDDLAGMFDADMGCIRRDITCGTLDDLKNAFAHLHAVCSIKAEGSVNGSFHLILDREGSITLAALLTASPRNKVLARHTRPSTEDADELNDAIAEAANLFAASWERTFRAGGQSLNCCARTNTLVADLWPQLRQSAAPAPEDQILVLHYQMTIDPYPPFPLALVFPKNLAADPNWQTTLPPEPEKQEQSPDGKVRQPSMEPAPHPDPAEQPRPPEPLEQTPSETTDIVAETQPQLTNQPPQEQAENAAHPETSEAAGAQESAEKPPENAAEPPNPEPETGPVSDAIKKMTASESEQSPSRPISAAEHATPTPLSTPAGEIMRTELVWADPEDTVDAVLAKMQDHNVSHVIVGQKPAPQGILSRSDIAGAMSPYLRPTFGKWRRPLDDATLRIKVKWIMSTPLTTIAADAPLSAIMEQMQQLHKRALPVLDAQGAIVGMITAFDIFAALLKPAPASNPAS